MCVCVCVCVWEREREEPAFLPRVCVVDSHPKKDHQRWVHVCACVCVGE